MYIIFTNIYNIYIYINIYIYTNIYIYIYIYIYLVGRFNVNCLHFDCCSMKV